jgi:hypothetical protein
MKQKFSYLLLINIVMTLMFFVGCAVDNDDDNKGKSENQNENTSTVSEVILEGKYSDVLFFDDENLKSDVLSEGESLDNEISIIYNGDTVDITNPYQDNGVSIICNGAKVMVNSVTDDFISFKLSGTSENGNFRLYTSKKYRLVFDNLNLKATDGPAINVQSKKRGFIEIIGECSLEDTESGYSSNNEEEDAKGTLFSEGQLIFDGTGTLNITANEKHAIGNDEYIRWNNATLKIISAKNDGIHVNDMLIVGSGKIFVESAGKNAIECEKGAIIFNGGEINVKSTNDAIKASYEGGSSRINPYIIISNAIVEAQTHGEEKAHGIVTESSIVIKENATVTVNANGNASKGIKSGGLISVGTAKAEDNTYISIMVDGSYVDEGENFAEPVGIKAGTSYKQYSGHVRIYNTGMCGRGIAASGNMEIVNSKIFSSLSGGYYTAEEEAPYNGWPKALKANGKMTVTESEIVIDTKEGKGISIEGAVTINSGNIHIISGHEGLESGSSVEVKGGNIHIRAGDDAVNAGGTTNFEDKIIRISGGYIYAESDCDVFDSNGYIYFDGGICVLVRTIDGGDTAIDPGDNLAGKGVHFNGGTVLAVGSVKDMWKQDVVNKYAGNNMIINNTNQSFSNLLAVDSSGKILSYYNGGGKDFGVLYATNVEAVLYKDAKVDGIEYKYNDEKYADVANISDKGSKIEYFVVDDRPEE